MVYTFNILHVIPKLGSYLLSVFVVDSCAHMEMMILYITMHSQSSLSQVNDDNDDQKRSAQKRVSCCLAIKE